jgi:hypothetical protein
MLWSWLLSAVGVIGVYAVSKGKTWGWLVNLCAQALWITYAVVTRQWGFLPISLAYAWVCARNYHRRAESS